MFDNLRNMGALASIMKDLPRLKAKMDEVKERMAHITVDAETGGGAVKAVANARMKLLSVRVDPVLLASLVDSDSVDDRAMAEDLITGAVNAALEKGREAAEQEMKSAAGEMGLPVPPGGLEGLLS